MAARPQPSVDPAGAVPSDMAARPRVDSAVPARLAAIISALDRRFDIAGAHLGRAVDAIGGTIAALLDVAGAFGEEGAPNPADDIAAAACRLADVVTVLEQREGDVEDLRSAAQVLMRNVADVERCLQVLQIYGINVKIAASGSPAFIDFANDMAARLKIGETGAKHFSTRLNLLAESVAHMQEQDAMLATECAGIMPQVPMALIDDAAALYRHQAHLAALARTTAELARAIEGELGVALGALQVGDRSRQRLEHVAAALAMLDGAASDPALAAPERAAMQRHVGLLLCAQAEATAQEYERDTRALVEAVRRIGEGARQVLALRIEDNPALEAGEVAQDEPGDGAMFLRRLEEGVAAAAGMIVQIDETEAQADRTLYVILDTVNEVAARASAIRNLRKDVRQMAINISLRCRKVEGIGRAVTVVANEIRSYSERLDELIGAIDAAEHILVDVAMCMRLQADERGDVAVDDLGRSVDAIRASARHTEAAMARFEQASANVREALENTGGVLDEAMDLAEPIAAVALALGEQAGAEEAPADPALHGDALRALLERIGASYTMADERRVHDLHRLPGMMPLLREIAPADDGLFGDDAPGGDPGDDGLFDDGLFDDGLFDDGLFDDGLFEDGPSEDPPGEAGTGSDGTEEGGEDDDGLF